MNQARVGRPLGHSADFEGRRERLLELAVRVFAERGYAETGVRELAKAAGISAAALYHYFPSKEALVAAIIDRNGSGPAEAIRRLPHDADLRTLLMSLGSGFFRAMAAPDAKAGLEVVFLAAHQKPEWAEQYLAGIADPSEKSGAELVEAALPEGARGRVRPEWLVKQLVGALLSFVLHEEVLRRAGANHPEREAYLEQVVDVLATGVEAMS